MWTGSLHQLLVLLRPVPAQHPEPRRQLEAPRYWLSLRRGRGLPRSHRHETGGRERRTLPPHTALREASRSGRLNEWDLRTRAFGHAEKKQIARRALVSAHAEQRRAESDRRGRSEEGGMIVKQRVLFALYSMCGILLKEHLDPRASLPHPQVGAEWSCGSAAVIGEDFP
ncbi:hypothetical protein MHYP_G00191710 [Metynnis hypsauchen]